MNQLPFRIIWQLLCIVIIVITPVLSDQILRVYQSGGGNYPADSQISPFVTRENGYSQDNPVHSGDFVSMTNVITSGTMPKGDLNNPGPNLYQGQIPSSVGMDRIIVKYKNQAIDNPERPISSMGTTITEAFGASLLTPPEPMESAGFQVVQVPSQSFDSVLTAYKESSLIEYAEPDYRISLEPSQTGINIIASSENTISSAIPNDPGFKNQWGLCNTGQSQFNGIVGADISAQEAWEYTTGSSEIVVAVLDSGIDYSHPDLAANIWKNEGEIPDNQIDDDGNGFIDDINGWNFVENTNSVFDDNGHGTHCAGTIGAVGNNNIGITGVNWNIRIMPLKLMDSSGGGNISDAVLAILYANQMGADVISCSWSGTENSNALRDAISASSTVVVCAAGNGGSNLDTTPVYPAAYDSPHIISVTATDASDNLASFSNYGPTSVDIAAPGVKIDSTYPGNQYAFMTGTSMATPYVSGVAALLKAVNPSLTNTQICTVLCSTADFHSSLEGKISSQGRLNAYRAVLQVSGSQQVQISPVQPVLPKTVPTQSVPITTFGQPVTDQISGQSPPSPVDTSFQRGPGDTFPVNPIGFPQFRQFP